MSEFNLRFHIEEAPDAKSFTFYDITGDYNANTNPGGWREDGGGDDPKREDIKEAKIVKTTIGKKDTSVDFKLNSETAAEWHLGVEFTVDDVIKDDAFKFELIIKFDDDTIRKTKRDFGFYALIKEEVMKESLSYRPEMQRTKREIMWEKLRLLDNLFYSTETDQIIHFMENLARLKKLK